MAVLGSQLRALILSLLLSLYSTIGCGGGEERQSESRPAPEPTSRLYYTQGLLEPDRIASAWLLTRHVDPGAGVRMLNESEEVPRDGTGFDVPGGMWVRQAKYCTYETILQSEGITDPGLVRIGALIHASEFSAWLLAQGSEEKRFDMMMKEFSLSEELGEAHRFLDSLYASGGILSEELFHQFHRP